MAASAVRNTGPLFSQNRLVCNRKYSIYPLKHQRTVVGNVEPMRAIKSRITPPVGMLSFVFVLDGEGRPCRVPELAVITIGKVQVTKVVVTSPSAEIQHDEEIAALAAREGKELTVSKTNVEWGWTLEARVAP